MNPRYVRTAERLKQLIEEGKTVAALERPSRYSGRRIEDKASLHSWQVKVENIIKTVFGNESAHFRHLNGAFEGGVYDASDVNKIIGILSGALSDLEDGFLVGQEHLVAGVVLDSVLEQARCLLNHGFKDPAAVLCRVVVEDTLRRLCREEKLKDSVKTTVLNDSLRDKGRYTKPQWRLIQSWLDIGNSAAHGKFSDFDDSDVKQMINDVERFLAQELGVKKTSRNHD